MKLKAFSPPANVDDLGTAELRDSYSQHISAYFDDAIAEVQKELNRHRAGTCPFYNPVSHGLAGADLFATITWNGFPRRFSPTHPGMSPEYAKAEPRHAVTIDGTRCRPQDEYLEWFVRRDENDKIVGVDFTCEAWDYFEFLYRDPASVLRLYQKFIHPTIKQSQLESGGQYDPSNRPNLRMGAMHLTHPSNALGAEIALAADATTRRRDRKGREPATATSLINIAKFGDGGRNSDPKIGFQVNQLARTGAAITLTDPVGLYMVDFDDAGWHFDDGKPASGFFRVLRGKPGKAIRATYELPQRLKAKGLTVSDVHIGGVPIIYGGQIAEYITMGIEGAVCRLGSFHNGLIPFKGARARAHRSAMKTAHTHATRKRRP